jgi:hypothetical protein
MPVHRQDCKVLLSLRLLIALIASSPFFLFLDETIEWAFLAAATAASLANIALNIGPGEADYLLRVIRPVAFLLAVPAVWMLVQIVPMAIGSLTHPVWTSAAAALNEAIPGRMSVDPGATLISLSRYLWVIGNMFAAMAVTIDRRRAEWILYSLTGAAGIVALLLVVDRFHVLQITDGGKDFARLAMMAAISTIGTTISIASAIRTFERYETRHPTLAMSTPKFLRDFAINLSIGAICWLAIADHPSYVFVAACSTATLLIIEAVRRIGMSRLAAAALAATMIIIIAIVAVMVKQNRERDITLHFASAPRWLMSIAEEMKMDTRWTGSGAGTFSSLAPIYREVDDPDVQAAPTTAAAIAIELGQPALIYGAALTVAAAGFLALGALRRGRDSFYPAAGAACVVAVFLEAFIDASALSTAVQIVAATLVGVALAQSKSRTVRPSQ